jgi:ribosomal protein L40E
MSSSEKRIGIIKDIILPLDISTRYDVYFTDRRIAIVCMGRANRFESEMVEHLSIMPSAFGVPAITSSYLEKTENRQAIDEETKNWSIDDLLKLSKKSCFYTFDEIEEIKLVASHKPKFVILSKECESKFNLNKDQIEQLSEILPTIETLRNKLSISGKWNILQEIFMANFCKFCGARNDPDVVCCQSCGKKIREIVDTDPISEQTCSSCGTKNKIQASFCKKCGTPNSMRQNEKW